jgi:hypothetical protein
LCVGVGLLIVNRSVEFDRKAKSGTTKVKNEWANWMLPPELQPTELAVAQPSPQDILSSRFPPT